MTEKPTLTAGRRPGKALFSALLVVTLAVTFSSACSDKTQESAKETADALQEDAKANADQAGAQLDEKAGEAAARAAAEDLRVRIKANATAQAQGVRSIAALDESAADVAGDPEIAGVADADGDGLDDDGKVQINVSGSSACLTLPATGDNTTVQGGAC